MVDEKEKILRIIRIVSTNLIVAINKVLNVEKYKFNLR